MNQSTSQASDKNILAVVRLYGEIGASGPVNTFTCRALLEQAFALESVLCVVLLIDCPGGCPTETNQIAQYLRRMSNSSHVPIYAVVESMAASGGYWIACAAEEIHCDATSMVGCIGVILMEFGVHRLLNRLEIEPWIITTGANKAGLTPFQDRNPAAELIERENLQVIHEAFIGWVKSRRPRLAELGNTDDVFSGRMYVGQAAVDKGLADHIATGIEGFIDNKYPDRHNLRIIEVRARTTIGVFGLLRNLFGVARGIGSFLSRFY